MSPSGRVPALRLGDTVVWDSLAIAEWAAEQNPDLLPRDPVARAICRSAVAEMHSGFAALRRDLSMNIRRRAPTRPWPEDVTADLARVLELWGELRGRFAGTQSGPFLLGARSLADAFYAPVCTRFRTYGVELPPLAAAYCDAVFADADFRAWETAAVSEPFAIPETDALYT